MGAITRDPGGRERDRDVLADFWTGGYSSGTGMLSRARSVLAHEYFHIAQFELAGPARHRTPGWLTEGTATWLSQGLLGRPLTVSDAQFGTTELNLATRFRPFDYAHWVGLAALTILIERSGTETVIDFWRNLAPRNGVTRSWQTAFRETFGLSSQEFYKLFYDGPTAALHRHQRRHQTLRRCCPPAALAGGRS